MFGKDEPWRRRYLQHIDRAVWFQVTPVQMVRAIAAIANGGNLPVPQIIAVRPQLRRSVFRRKIFKSCAKACVSR